MELDIFLREQNIARYHKLLNSRTDAAERRTILKLLAGEMNELQSTHHEKTGKTVGESTDVTATDAPVEQGRGGP